MDHPSVMMGRIVVDPPFDEPMLALLPHLGVAWRLNGCRSGRRLRQGALALVDATKPRIVRFMPTCFVKPGFWTVLVSVLASAAAATPVGLWKTVDDKTGEARSHVRIIERNGVLSGRIEDILDQGKRDARCMKCVGARKDQPVRGMVIIEGARLNNRAGYWDGGTILDPNDGKIYTLRLTPKAGGQQLEVRGFVGPFYRNQYWIRLE